MMRTRMAVVPPACAAAVAVRGPRLPVMAELVPGSRAGTAGAEWVPGSSPAMTVGDAVRYRDTSPGRARS